MLQRMSTAAISTQPDDEAIAFSQSDCKLFARLGRRPLGDVSEADQAELRRLRNVLKRLASHLAAAFSESLPFTVGVSAWNVHGRTPPDLWCCAYPAVSGHKSYALQIGFILSERGGEITFCLGSGDTRRPRSDEWAARFGHVKERLEQVPPELAEQVESSLSSWSFQRQWRLSSAASEFSTLADWLAYAASPRGNGAAISRYLDPHALELLGEGLLDEIISLGQAVMPIVRFAYDAEDEAPRLPVAPSAKPAEPPEPTVSYDLDWLAERTLWSTEELLAVIDTLEGDAPQVVLAGPPGTGKTWVAKHLIRYLTQDRPDCHRMVQFHPSYGYEDFLEGLRPKVRGGAIAFERVDGILLEIVGLIRDRQTPFYLLIDEMNRANLSRVFGELMYLFEYRDETLSLRYTRDFRLPKTLRFIGTMNTADRSIRSIDIALRRRFDVFECPPRREILEAYYAINGHENEVVSLFEGFERLNGELRERIDRHHTVGQTFFMAPKMTVTKLRGIWARKVLPLLEEYFFDQPEVVTSIFTPERFWPELAD